MDVGGMLALLLLACMLVVTARLPLLPLLPSSVWQLVLRTCLSSFGTFLLIFSRFPFSLFVDFLLIVFFFFFIERDASLLSLGSKVPSKQSLVLLLMR